MLPTNARPHNCQARCLIFLSKLRPGALATRLLSKPQSFGKCSYVKSLKEKNLRTSNTSKQKTKWRQPSLQKIPQFHLIFYCGNFVGKHSFCIDSGDSPETMRKLCLSTKFTQQKVTRNYVIFCSASLTLFQKKKIISSMFGFNCGSNFWIGKWKSDVEFAQQKRL